MFYFYSLLVRKFNQLIKNNQHIIRFFLGMIESFMLKAYKSNVSERCKGEYAGTAKLKQTNNY